MQKKLTFCFLLEIQIPCYSLKPLSSMTTAEMFVSDYETAVTTKSAQIWALMLSRSSGGLWETRAAMINRLEDN